MKLYDYQVKALANLPSRGIMAWDTGTGKTFASLAHYERYGNGRPLLILAPASKVRTQDWEREIALWFQGRAVPQFEIYSYERFSRNPSNREFRNGKRAIWHKASPKYGGTEYAIIADEVHRAKSWKSGIGKALYWAAKDARFFVGLSATPLPNGWIDFANYSKIFGFTKGITEFKKRYCVYVDYKGFPELKEYLNTHELWKQWTTVSRRLQKKDANDLPDRVFEGVNFQKPPIYKKTIITRTAPDGTLLDTAPALQHALRQTLTEGKIAYTSDIIDGTNENIVIFYNYISERDAILAMLAKDHSDRRVFRMDGEKHELPAKEDWAKVERSVTLAHYRSGSTGVEMTYATVVIYFSPTYSYADYIQSIGRVHRNGQTQKTTFYNLRTPATIEEDVYEALRNKQDFQSKQWKER